MSDAAKSAGRPLSLTFHPLTPDRWADFERLFGPRGAYGGCWCMWWRSTRAQFEARGGQGNRQAMLELVSSGQVPGLLAYAGGEPVGWCSVAPRDSYGSLNRSPVLKKLDERPVWSIVCFYVAKEYRRQGMMLALIRGAVDYVGRQGGRTLEAYPTLPRGRRLADVSSFMGLPEAFAAAGFLEVSRPSKSRAIMRYEVPADG